MTKNQYNIWDKWFGAMILKMLTTKSKDSANSCRSKRNCDNCTNMWLEIFSWCRISTDDFVISTYCSFIHYHIFMIIYDMINFATINYFYFADKAFSWKQHRRGCACNGVFSPFFLSGGFLQTVGKWGSDGFTFAGRPTGGDRNQFAICNLHFAKNFNIA